MSTSRPGEAGRQQRTRVILIGTAVVVVLAVIIVIAVATASGSRTPSASSTSTSTSTSKPTPTSSTDPSSAPSSAVPSPASGDSPSTGETIGGQTIADSQVVGAPAAFGTGVTAAVTAVTDVTVDGSGRGDTDGPGIEVALTFTNGSAAAVDLSTVVVNAYYGDPITPASPSQGDSAGRPLTGSLAAGSSGEGTYLFTVPAAQRSSVVVTVGYSGTPPIVTFTR